MSLILVVEDDETTQKIVGRALVRAGHEVVSFDDAVPALLWGELDTVDAIVTDLVMPTPAEHLIRNVRARGLTVPIIVMSAYLAAEEWREVGEVGATCFVQKPLELRELVGVVNRHLSEDPAQPP
jgi:two-component system nitrogen regulation response regulator GlnG